MMALIERLDDADRLLRALARAPIVLLTGPRQAGKSTGTAPSWHGRSASRCRPSAATSVRSPTRS